MLQLNEIILDYPKNNTPEEQFISEGDAHLCDSKFEEALHCYRQAIDLCPHHHYAQLRRADVFLLQEQVDDSLLIYQYLKSIAVTDPSLTEFFNLILKRLGLVYKKKEEYNTAIDYFTQSLQIKDDDMVLTYRAEVFTALGSEGEALNDLNQALALNPSNLTAIYDMAFLLYDMKNFRQSLFYFTELLIPPNPTYDKAVIYAHRGMAYFMDEEYDLAFEDYHQVLTLKPDEAYYYNERAKLYIQLNKMQEALTDLNQSARLQPGNLNTLYLRQMVHFKMGNFELALRDINVCLEDNPSHLWFNESKVKILIKLGDFTSARPIIERLCAHQPNNDSFIALKREIYHAEPLITVQGHGGEYRSRGRSPSVLMRGNRQMTPGAQPTNGSLALTRFFTDVDDPNTPLRVIKEPKYKNDDKKMQHEWSVWNAFYPEDPAYYFKLTEDDCRLDLPFFNGKTLIQFMTETPPPLPEFLQIWLAVSIELYRLHLCGSIHGDLKWDNIIVMREKGLSHPVSCQIRLIDFGSSEKIYDHAKPYTGLRPTHFAPEWYGNSTIIVDTKLDVYSLSSEILKTVWHSEAKKLPPILQTFLTQRGCNSNPSYRPLLTEIIGLLCQNLLNYPIGEPLLCHFMTHVKLSGLHILLKEIDNFNEIAQRQLKQYPALIKMIVNQYQKNKTQFNDLDSFIPQLSKLSEVRQVTSCQTFFTAEAAATRTPKSKSSSPRSSKASSPNLETAAAFPNVKPI